MIPLYPCPDCPNGLSETPRTSCVRCVAKFEADFNPIERTVATRVTRWQRFLAWCEDRFPELGDFVREDDE